MIGGLAGGGANLIGNAAQGLGSFQKELARSLAHGSLGGLTSLAQGGKFKHGFFSGMFASMAGSGMEASGWGVFSTDVGSVVTAAVVGGTASELGGGKFANGAVTGAYTMLFNHMAHRPEDPPVDYSDEGVEGIEGVDYVIGNDGKRYEIVSYKGPKYIGGAGGLETLGGPLRKGQQAIKLGKYLFNPGALHATKQALLKSLGPSSFAKMSPV